MMPNSIWRLFGRAFEPVTAQQWALLLHASLTRSELEVQLQLDFEHVVVEEAEAAREGSCERVVAADVVVGLNLEIMLADVEVETDADPVQLLADKRVELFVSDNEFRARVANIEQVAELGIPAV